MADDDFYALMNCYLDTGQVDIVFCMDTSHSMEPYLEDLRENMNEFVDSIVALGYDFRLGAVPFDDSTNVWDFDTLPGNQMTADTVVFNSWLADVDVSEIASDSWEVSLDAIFDALTLYEWRDDALRIIIMFTNEGYHSTEDDTNLSDVSYEQVRDTVLSTGAVVFIAASSRPPWVGSPIPAEHMENFVELADTSGGRLDSLTNDWTFIFEDVVSLVSTFTSVAVTIQNLTGSATNISSSLEPLEPGCLAIHSENPVSSSSPIPAGGYFRAFWKVIVDTTCSEVNKCFDLPIWGGGSADTSYGCITDELCYGYTDASIAHTPPDFTATCLEISPNPAALDVTLYNDGIRPLTDVEVTFTPLSGDINIVGGDPNPSYLDEVSYLSSEDVSWQLEVASGGAGESHSYRISLNYAEGSAIVENYSIDIPAYLTPPEISITRGDTILCPGEGITLEASIMPSGSWDYEWMPHTGLDDPYSLTPMASPDVTTTYTLSATDGYDCMDSEDITIIVADTVLASAGADTIVFPGRPVTLGGDPAGYGGYGSLSYQWSPTEGLSDPNSPNPDVSPYLPIEYILIVTDGAGCQDYDTVQIDIQPPIGYILVQDEIEILELRVIDTLDAIIEDNGVIMVQMPGGMIGAADLVDSTDTWASPVLIQTTRGIRSWRHKIYTP